MTCRELTGFIMDYLAGELPQEVRITFEDHLAICPDCVNYLAAYQGTVELNRRAFADEDARTALDAPEDLVKAILLASRRSP